MKYINAKGLILGRMASQVAKMLLNGEEVVIVNSEETIITGSRENIFEQFETKRRRTHRRKGPNYPRMPDRIIKRTVRGMLPYKSSHGKEAFQRLKVYIGVPKEFANAKLETLEKAGIKKTLKFLTVGEVSQHMGSKYKVV